eukprot:m.53855 g.53855  ORF g.53855 m.53855 type:complete len:553 (+) comp7488_c0_seq3:47-1705(+)
MAGLFSWVGDALFGDDTGSDGTAAAKPAASPDPAPVFPDNMVSKEHLYEIFSSFAAAIESPEGKKRLADAVAAGENVEDVTQAMQEEAAEKAGLNGKETCDHFKFVLRYYKDDPVLCEEFLKFCERESNACDEAEMGPDKFKEAQEKLKHDDLARDKYRSEYAALPPAMRENMAKQLIMLSKSSAEMNAMLDKTEANMRKLLVEKPMVKAMIVQQIKSQFAAMGAADELDEHGDVIGTMISKVKEGTQFMREKLTSEAKERDISFDELIQQKLEAIQAVGGTQGGHGAAAAAGAGAGGTPTLDLGKLRFKVGDAISAKLGSVGDNWEDGRVVAVGYREPHFPPEFVAPYQIQLNSGRMIFAPYDNDSIVRARQAGADEPIITQQVGKGDHAAGALKKLRFNVGDKVSARVSPTKWADAIVLSTHFSHPNMPAGMTAPYQLQVEETGDLMIAPHDVPEIVCERGSDNKPTVSTERRFKVGDRVEARVSMVPAKWLPAVVESVNYREPNFPPGAMAPYRLRLDNGQKIFAPHDVDEVVRKPTGEGTVIESAPGL